MIENFQVGKLYSSYERYVYECRYVSDQVLVLHLVEVLPNAGYHGYSTEQLKSITEKDTVYTKISEINELKRVMSEYQKPEIIEGILYKDAYGYIEFVRYNPETNNSYSSKLEFWDQTERAIVESHNIRHSDKITKPKMMIWQKFMSNTIDQSCMHDSD